MASVESLMNEGMHAILRRQLPPDTAPGVRSYYSDILKKVDRQMFADPPLFFHATNSVSLLYIPLTETQPFFRNL